jgi:hypothetical protein
VGASNEAKARIKINRLLEAAGWRFIVVPTIEVQNLILSSIAEEKAQIDSARRLIETYEARTKTVIAKLWSE